MALHSDGRKVVYVVSASQIVSLQPGEEWRTIELRNALEARGVFGSVFCAPATPLNGSLIRFTLNSALSI